MKAVEENNKCGYDFDIDYCDRCDANRWTLQYACIAEKDWDQEREWRKAKEKDMKRYATFVVILIALVLLICLLMSFFEVINS